jgi:hypothetical protein
VSPKYRALKIGETQKELNIVHFFSSALIKSLLDCFILPIIPFISFADY